MLNETKQESFLSPFVSPSLPLSFFVSVVVKIGTYCTLQTNVKFKILLHQLSECWSYSYMLLCPAKKKVFLKQKEKPGKTVVGVVLL